MLKTNLILLPGLDGTGQLFSPFIKTLPLHLSPQVVSYPANKFLDHDALVEFVKEKVSVNEPFALLAESFSGPVALKLAAAKPRNLIALILCATFVCNPLAFPSSVVASWFSRLFFSFQLPGPLVRYFLIGTDAPQELAEQFQQAIQAVAPDVLAGRLKSLVNVDVRDELRDCEKPILYLQARRDKLVSKKCLQEILLLKPNLENVTIDAPHLVLQREPERAVKAIEEFLQKQTP